MARYKEYLDASTYRIYLTESIKNFLGLKVSYYDIITNKPKEKEKTGDEIVEETIRKAGLIPR